MSERKMKDRREHIYLRSVAEIVERANLLIEQYPHLTLDTISVGTDEEYGDTYAALFYETPETDAERRYRTDWDKRIADNRRQQYEALKKEFEK